MPGQVLRRQKQRTLPSKCAPLWMPRPGGTTPWDPRRPACPASARHRRPGRRFRWNEFHPPAIDRSGCCWCGGAAMRTSLRRIAMAAAAVIAVGAATAALSGTAEARWHGGGWHGGWRGHGGWGGGGLAGASRLVSRSASVRRITAATMAARITHTGANASCAAAG